VTLAFLAIAVPGAQEPGPKVMHVPAHEFPPPASLVPDSGDLSGSPATGAQPEMQRSASASQPGMNLPPAIPRQGEPSPAIEGVTWINCPPLIMQELLGKVVMIDFWDPTCLHS